MKKEALFVTIGGVLGGLSRLLLQEIIPSSLFVNYLGCLIAGLFYTWYRDEKIFSIVEKNFFFIGFLGSLTTFSGFIEDLADSHFFSFFTVLFSQIFGSFFLFFVGKKIGKFFEKKTVNRL